MIALLLVAILAQTPQELVRKLGSEDYETRERAMRELKEMGAIALPALAQATKSNDPEVRTRAEELLPLIRQTLDYGAPIDAAKLAALKQCFSPDINRRHIGPGPPIGTPPPPPASTEGMWDLPYRLALLDAGEAMNVRLGVLASIRGVHLTTADEDRLCRILPRAIPSLSEPPTEHDANAFLTFLHDVVELHWPAATHAIAGPAEVGILLLARSPSVDVRLHLAVELAGLKDERVKPVLAGLLEDSNSDIAEQALRSLCEHDVRDTLRPIRRYRDACAEPNSRLLATFMLARSGDICGLATLFSGLQDPEPLMRLAAVHYLNECLGRPPADGERPSDVEALKLWWAENREIVHWDPVLKTFTAR